MRTVRPTRPGVSVNRVALRASAAVLAAALSCECAPVFATAFYINQQSVKGLGRVDAGNTAAADDLSTIFLNPAGLNELWKDKSQGTSGFSLATHLIIPRGTQRNAGSNATALGTGGAALPYAGGDSRNPTDPTPVPNTYLAAKWGEKGSVGLGVNVPFGLRASFDKDWYGRYDAIEASLRTINVSAVAAYQVADGLTIGGGIDGQYARSTLTTAIPDPLSPGGPTAQSDGRIATKGDAYTPGFNLGLMYSFSEGNRLGVHYRSGMTHKIKGTAEITGLTGPLAPFNGEVGARADLKLPAIGTVGLRLQASDELVLLGELEWFDWSTFREVRIRFDDGRPDGVRVANYRDAYAVALGAEYRARGSRWTARGGLHYDTTPTVDAYRDTTVPDSERLWLGLGATYRPGDAFQADFAFNHVFFRKTDIALTRAFFENTPLATDVRINGGVRTVVNTVSVDLRWRF